MTGWIAFNRLEPFGQRQEWLRTGVLAQLIANINRKKGARPFTPEDFMPGEPKLHHAPGRQTAEQMKTVMTALFDNFRRKGLVRKRSAEPNPRPVSRNASRSD